jgi:hypothetical protein
VFAGFGITALELGYDDYAGVDARGKIALIFDHEPQENDPKSRFNGTGNTRYATSRVKVLNAQKHGAVAVVIVAEPNRKHLTNAERAGLGDPLGGASKCGPMRHSHFLTGQQRLDCVMRIMNLHHLESMYVTDLMELISASI